MPQWAADFTVDEQLARRLLSQFPELHVESLRPFAEGWDNAVWLVNEEWAFRFPRREIAIRGVRLEIELLPRIAGQLPVPVPEPAFVGEPEGGFPWPFFGARLLAGSEACDVPLIDDERSAVGVEIAAFLRALHALQLDGADLPVDPNRRADLPFRVARAEQALRELEREGLWHTPPNVPRLLDEAERLPPWTGPVICHGDLHFRHVLVDTDRRLSGIIDWGDLCRADAAIDLMLLWSFVPPAGRQAFLDAYGPVTDARLLNARILALHINAALARYARAEGMASVEREALAGLDRAAAD